MKLGLIRSVVLGVVCSATLLSGLHADAAKKPAAKDPSLNLELRSRVETGKESGQFHVTRRSESWNPRQTAIIVCDMWDLHHCLNATRRGGEMAPRMNKFLTTARDRGVTIIHAPSGCMAAYENHPARKNAKSVTLSKQLPTDIGKWCYKIPEEERGTYPIDQTDGGEDDDPAEHADWAKKLAGMGRNPKAPWKRQTDTLEIHDQDYVSDQGDEIWSILEQKNISGVMLVGVHVNMCVLGRPFGLRQMSKNGKNVVLVRDLTDTMYNPEKAPQVSHFSGTDLIIQHIEKFVCPTITSDQILGDRPFRFKHDRRPRLVIVMGEREYQTRRTLPTFALEHLAKHFSIDYVFANEQDRNDLPGLEKIDDADIALISVRRRVLPKSQLDAVRRFVAAGKPLIGLRTANHAFSLNGKSPPADRHAWENFDEAVIGGHYTGHSGRGEKVKVQSEVAEHPILLGVDLGNMQSSGTLYTVRPLAKTAKMLLSGTIPKYPTEPVAWVNQRKDGGRTFYTSLGHPDDFKSPDFNRLLRNAIYWMADVKISDRVKYGE